MNGRRLGWVGLAALGAVSVVSGCSSSSGGSSATNVVLRGEYNATQAGEFFAVTFLDASTYTAKRKQACSAHNAFCVEHGTYTLDAASGLLTLTSAETGATDKLPFSVLTSQPMVQAATGRLRTLGGVSLTGGGDASLTEGSDASLTEDGGSLTQDGGSLLAQIEVALTFMLDGQSVSSGSGADNGDAGGDSDGGAPLTFEGGADLDAGDNGTNEPDAWVDAGGSDDAGGGGDAATSSDGGSASVDGGTTADAGTGSGSGSAKGTGTGSGSAKGSGTGGGGTGQSSGTGSGTSGSGSTASDAGPCGSGNFSQQASNGEWSSYQPAKAVSYADAHWGDGVGLCAQFTSASVSAGGVPLTYTWVPDIVTALSGVAYDEYSPSNTSVQARAGDIVVYSNATGNEFCQTHNVNERNCGHVGLVATSGNATTATADFHNGAHHHLGIKYILEGTTVGPSSHQYSTFRVYHVAALSGACGG